MRFLAQYVMRDRLQAILVTAVTALLSPLLPLLAYLSGAAVGLVTLRVGHRQGLLVIAAAALLLSVLSGVMFGNPLLGIGFALVLWLPVWVLAANLRRSVDLAQSLKLSGLFGLMLVVGIYLATDNPVTWWKDALQKVLAPALEGAAKEQSMKMSVAIAQTAQVMSGFIGGLMGLSALGCLFIARWWQAMLYNPGGFQSEFHQIRLGGRFALATAVVGLLLMITSSETVPMATDLLVVLVMLFMIQGLAVSHYLVAKAGANTGWLVLLYLMVILVPHAALTLAVAGIADNRLDFRTFFGVKPKQ